MGFKWKTITEKASLRTTHVRRYDRASIRTIGINHAADPKFPKAGFLKHPKVNLMNPTSSVITMHKVITGTTYIREVRHSLF